MNIQRTRMTARGYKKSLYVCADCGLATAATLTVNRDGSIAFVHRAGAGCHKGVDAHTIRHNECKH